MRQMLIVGIVACVAAGALGFFVFLNKRPAELVRMTINGQELFVSVAADEASREKGLSGRKGIMENEGMLFVTDHPDFYGIHMKDMRFAIDIIWIGQDKRVVAIEEGVLPETYPKVFQPPTSIQYVVEVNTGWARRHMIRAGEAAVLPAPY